MAEENLPRGIRVIKWINSDGSESIRYRIRMERKELNIDKTFSDLENAKKFLKDTKDSLSQKKKMV